MWVQISSGTAPVEACRLVFLFWKTLFIEVEVFPEEDPAIFSTKDIKVETMHCSGNGGQNVNKLETGVRITHLRTGLTATAQEERSQLQNKKLALQRLRKRFDELNSNRKQHFAAGCWKRHQAIKRGEPLRTFKGKAFIELKLK